MKKDISASDSETLLETLKNRFEKNMHRHQNQNWQDVAKKLLAKPEKMWSLQQMEISGGEPDVVGQDEKTNEFLFFDCALESPKERRSLCYDRAALDGRKQNKPKNSAIDVAESMGISILDEAQYKQLQRLGKCDTKTSSWIKTPEAIRKLGGAVFCDYRYGTMFLYHNGADSYYASRGFRGFVAV